MSLRLRAVLITGISLVLLWLAAATWMMRDVQTSLDRALDGRLAMSAHMVAGLMERAALGPPSASAPPEDAVNVGSGDGIACEIRSLRGEILARTTNTPPSGETGLSPGFSTRELDGIQWRIYVLHTGDYQITTSDRIEQRHTLTDEMLSAASIPFLVAVLGGLAALWAGIGRALKPLKALSRQLQSKEIDDTTPIELKHPPQEMRPVLDAMNGVLGQLARALSSQRAFTDAAAHELRTPLTVIDTHLQVIRLADGQEAEASLASAEEGVRRLRRTLDQMMTLARTEAIMDKGDHCDSVLSVVQHILNYSSERVTLRIDGADAASAIPASILETALRNLIDNALRYSPAPAPVEVSVKVDKRGRTCTFVVADRGPGLSPEQLTLLGQRFWRAQPNQRRAEGAGLGISIVRAIAARFGGMLAFSARDAGGLIAKLTISVDPV